jgi:hypothetical protein
LEKRAHIPVIDYREVVRACRVISRGATAEDCSMKIGLPAAVLLLISFLKCYSFSMQEINFLSFQLAAHSPAASRE